MKLKRSVRICKCSLDLFFSRVPGSQSTRCPAESLTFSAGANVRPHSPSARAPAIRQHFNRVCAFAWKSLKLNASDGNLYASLCLRIYGRSCEGGNSKENGGVSPGYQGLSVPKLICVGLWERDKLCRQGIWPLLAIFGFFIQSSTTPPPPPPAAAAAAALARD